MAMSASGIIRQLIEKRSGNGIQVPVPVGIDVGVDNAVRVTVPTNRGSVNGSDASKQDKGSLKINKKQNSVKFTKGNNLTCIDL